MMTPLHKYILLLIFSTFWGILFSQNASLAAGKYELLETNNYIGDHLFLYSDGSFEIFSDTRMRENIIGQWLINDSLIYISSFPNFDKLPICVIEKVDTLQEGFSFVVDQIYSIFGIIVRSDTVSEFDPIDLKIVLNDWKIGNFLTPESTDSISVYDILGETYAPAILLSRRIPTIYNKKENCPWCTKVKQFQSFKLRFTGYLPWVYASEIYTVKNPSANVFHVTIELEKLSYGDHGIPFFRVGKVNKSSGTIDFGNNVFGKQ